MAGKDLKTNSLLKLLSLIFIYLEESNSLFTGSYTLLRHNSITNEGKDCTVMELFYVNLIQSWQAWSGAL